MKTFFVGVDEVGRGSIAGPVVAAAIILKKKEILSLKDSKLLSSKKRQILSEDIKKNCVDYAIAEVSSKKIDKINIRQASLLAMKMAVEKLKKKNIEVVVDGVDKIDISQKCKAIVKADNIYKEVMAASIIAKVYRDELMTDLDKKYPQYLFAKHKGYPTKDHLHALKKFGSIEEHRKTFGPIKKLNE